MERGEVDQQFGVGDDLQEHVQQLARVAPDQRARVFFGKVHMQEFRIKPYQIRY